MNKLRKVISAILPVLIVIATIGGWFSWVNSSENIQPYNPLLNNANASHMLLSSGGNLSVNQDLLGDEDEKNGQNGEDESSFDDSQERSSQSVRDESNNAIEDNISENYFKSTKSNKFIYQNDGNENIGDKTFESMADSNNSDIISVDTDSSNEMTLDITGDSQQDILNSDNERKEYFTTTIENGITLKSRDFSFEINHNYPEFKVVSEDVFVNKNKQVQFHGNVLLNNGRNSIRVAVKYVDASGKVIAVSKSYVLFVDLGEIKIETSLSDFSTKKKDISFNASATFDNKPIDLNVTCNGNLVNGTDNSFHVNLIVGVNVIILDAGDSKLKKTLEFHIICTADKPVSIETNLLEEQIVYNEDFKFYARVVDGSKNSTLNSYINNKRITEKDDNEYSCKLKIGNNVVRLKAVDDVKGKRETLNKTYVVKYVPVATAQTAPYIKSVNITDGMTIKGIDFTLNILACDYQGEKIYQNGISVKLNGTLYPFTWASKFISYRLWLENGANTIDIRVTDKDGRYTDFRYIINCEAVLDGEKIGTITFSLDASVLGLGYLIESIEVDIHQGENMAELIARVLDENEFTYSYDNTFDEGFYFTRIAKPGIAARISIPSDLVDAINKNGLEWNSNKFNDSLGAHDYCQGSGWMYSVNGAFPNFSMSDCAPKDGDVVKIRYTLAYGRDIGGAEATGTVGGQNYDKIW